MFIEGVSSEPLWYVVHTYSGYENKVKASLERVIENRGMQDYFFEIVIPMLEEVEIKEGREKSALKKIFPGYILLKMIMKRRFSIIQVIISLRDLHLTIILKKNWKTLF